jgi:hypothetical protein
MSVITCGVGAWLSKGVNVARMGLNGIIKKVGIKLLEAGVTALTGFAIDKVMDAAVQQIVSKFTELYAKYMQPSFASIQQKLKELYNKTSNKQAVISFMDKLANDFFSGQVIADKIVQYSSQLFSAFASAVGNAVKQRIKHMAGFTAMKAFSEMLTTILKTTKFATSIIRACTEMSQFVSSASYQVDLSLSDVVRNVNSNTTEIKDSKFIDDKTKEWDRMIRDRMTSYIHDGILKPQVKHTINNYLQKTGRYLKEIMFKKDYLHDAKREETLLEAREKNMHKLASKDPIFGGKYDTRTATQVLADEKAVESCDPADNSICSNTDGYTVKEIKEKLRGVIFYRVGDGKDQRIIFLPPKKFDSAISDNLTTEYYNANPELKLTDGFDSVTIQNNDGTAHRAPRLPDGTMVDIPSLSSGGRFCDEQVRLFNLKLRELGGIFGPYTQEHIAKAKEYAQDPVPVYQLRQKILNFAPRITRDYKFTLGRSIDLQVGVKGDPKQNLECLEKGYEIRRLGADHALELAEDLRKNWSHEDDIELTNDKKSAIARIYETKKSRDIENAFKLFEGENMPTFKDSEGNSHHVSMHHIISDEYIRSEIVKLTPRDIKKYYDSLDTVCKARIYSIAKDAYSTPTHATLCMLCFDPYNVRIGPKERNDDESTKQSPIDIKLIPSDKRDQVKQLVDNKTLKITDKLIDFRRIFGSEIKQPIYKKEIVVTKDNKEVDKWVVSDFINWDINEQLSGGRVYAAEYYNPIDGSFSEQDNFKRRSWREDVGNEMRIKHVP